MKQSKLSNESCHLSVSSPIINSNEQSSLNYGSVGNKDLNQQKKEYKIGVTYMLLSSLTLSFQGVTVQIGKKLGYHAFELLLARGIVQLLLNLILQLLTNKNNRNNNQRLDFHSFESKHWIYIIIRGIIGFSVAIFVYSGVQLLNLGDAMSLFSTFPIWTIIICYIFLKENIHRFHIISLIFGMIGIILVSQPTFIFSHSNTNHINELGVFYELLAAIFNGFAFLILRKMKNIQAIYAIYSYSICCIIGSTIYGLIYGFQNWKGIDFNNVINNGYKDILVLICVGIFGFGGQLFMTKSTQFVEASVGSLVRSTDVVFAYLWQILIFGVTPTYITVIGSICIVSAVVIIAIRRIKQTQIELS